jgi:hypothetical protein
VSAIPQELRDRQQWVCWRYEDRDGKHAKVPYAPVFNGRRRASSTNPRTWGSFDAAARVARMDGVGFVFAARDPYVGVDLDDCVENGVLHPAVQRIVDALDSYTELSPSGTGVHVILRAKLAGTRKRTGKTPWGGEIETYDAGRFFCMTGQHVEGTPTSIRRRQQQLDEVRAELLPESPAPAAPARVAGVGLDADDRDLIERARAAKNGPEFERLWRGDIGGYGDDRSRADLALCSMLAFWAGPDPDRVDRLFSQSGLMRDKWLERRGKQTYGQMTVAKAIAGRSEFYGDRQRAATPAARAASIPAATEYTVAVDEKGRLALPDLPDHDDAAGLCQWLTAVFNLSGEHPVTGGEWQGVRGPDGHVALHRAGARGIRFEPARHVNNPARLVEALSWQRATGDGAPYPYKANDCRLIAHAIGCLCDMSEALDEEQEAAGIVGTFMAGAVAVEGYTAYGTTQQRYEAAVGLRRAVDEVTGRPIGPARYLIDASTGERVDEQTGEIIDEGAEPEIVVAVSELADAARRHVGSTLPRGWLDARMAVIGFERITVEGWQQAGRAGRRGAHARVWAYRGTLGTNARDHVTTQNHNPMREKSERARSRARSKDEKCGHVGTADQEAA